MYNNKLHFHFVGIGGSGMSGLAEILLTLGFRVSGSDLKSSSVVTRLAERGTTIFLEHNAANLADTVSLVVYSSAVTPDNPEVLEAKRRHLPVIPRAEVLAELMRLKYGVAVAGSHGKTTTTSMTACILEAAAMDPTVVIGGQVRSIGSGGKWGKGEFLVAETDESDRSFLLLKPTLAVVTNIDSEHLNAYASLAELEESFEKFVNAVPFYGLAIFCIDDQRVRDIAARYTRRKVTYGLAPDADIRAGMIRHDRTMSTFEVSRGGEVLGEITLPMPGKHIVVNCLAAIAVAFELGIDFATIRTALASFGGVGRRLEVVAEVGGVTVMNDYGHHPTEVKATLRAIRDGWGANLRRLHVVFQPHRYSRTKSCFVDFLDAFHDCDELMLTEIYAASEEPIEGVSGQALCDAISHPRRTFIGEPQQALPRLLERLETGDIVVCLGAGSIGQLPEQIVLALRQRAGVRLSAA